MIEFLLGAIASAALYTFFPALAEVPANWLRAARARIQSRKASDTDRTGV